MQENYPLLLPSFPCSLSRLIHYYLHYPIIHQFINVIRVAFGNDPGFLKIEVLVCKKSACKNVDAYEKTLPVWH